VREAEPVVRRSLHTAAVLVAVTVAGFGLVTLVHEATRDAVAAAAHERQLARFAEVLQGQSFDNDPLADVLELRDPDLLGTREPVRAYRARLGAQPVAVVLEPVAPDGYAGAIRLLVAIAPDGTLLGVRVLQHRETPGLGDAIEPRKSDWIERFAGRSLRDPAAERWHVRKDGGDFDQFTGATITPRAVVGAVANALAYFERHRDELLAPAVTIPTP
jgi:electron transport complex protein RnfG